MAVVLLSIIGLGVRHAIVNTMENGLRSELQTLLDVETAMLETWFHSQRSNAESLANGVDLRRLVYQLLDDSASNSTTHAKDEKSVGQVQAQLDKTLAPALSAHDYTRYLIADKSKRIVAATSRELIGQQDVPEYDSFLSRARRRDLRLNAFPQNEWRKDEKRRLLRTGGANDVRHAPDRDESFQVVAVLGCAFDRSKSLHDPAVGPRRQYR
jgi:Tfp pilus assembly protein PilV